MEIKHLLHSVSPAAFVLLKEARDSLLISRHRSMSESEVRAELARMYKRRVGKSLNLEAPQTYTEKIQWRKLNEITDEMRMLTDKYAVRRWVSDRVGKEYLVPLLGKWTDAKDIDFDSLPNEFVLKTNNASGTNYLVYDKTTVDVEAIRKKFNKWLDFDMAFIGFEYQYLNIAPCVIAEKLIRDSSSGDSQLRDYKFLCFDGRPHYIWVDTDRDSNHARAVFDTSWRIQEWNQYTYPTAKNVEKPACLPEMLELASALSTGFSHVRVDLYNVDGRPYFGEMTFTNGSGFERIVPSAYDRVLGDLWQI